MCSSSLCSCDLVGKKLPADWAIQKAINYSRGLQEWTVSSIKNNRGLAYVITIIELARMIETYEKPPVDPLLLKAREIYKEEYDKQYPDYSDYIECINKGKWDAGAGIQAVLTALRSCQ